MRTPRKTRKRTVEQVVNAGGKTWCELKRLSSNKKGWKYFTAALRSTANSDRIDKHDDDNDDEDDEYYINIRCFKSSVMLHGVDF
jgi:hypothetical protein